MNKEGRADMARRGEKKEETRYKKRNDAPKASQRISDDKSTDRCEGEEFGEIV